MSQPVILQIYVDDGSNLPVTENGLQELQLVTEGANEMYLREVPPAEVRTNVPVLGYPGESAYEIAVRHGFVGTEEEWLESLKQIYVSPTPPPNPNLNQLWYDIS